MSAWQPVRCHKCSHFSFISLKTAFTGSECSHPTSTSHSEQRHEPRVTKRKTEEKGHGVKPLPVWISQRPIVWHAGLLVSIRMERLLPLKNECENLKVMKKSKVKIPLSHNISTKASWLLRYRLCLWSSRDHLLWSRTGPGQRPCFISHHQQASQS